MAKLKDEFFHDISDILSQAKSRVTTAVNLTMVYSYFEVGRRIVEEEQNGNARAAYGTHMLKDLSVYLTKLYGNGFSVGTLKNIRQFYKIYANDQIGETAFSQFDNLPATSTDRKFYLSWSHYLKLMRIENVNERHFYEIEAAKNNWSIRELNRQCDSALYERLALSRDKDGILQLAQKGQIVEKTSDAIKDPYVLEFLGLEEKSEYSESDLENHLIDNLQKFLLELGAGYTFVARQKRFTFNEDHFRVDLVFYNRLMQCFVLFDLKIGKLKHQDLGQMQMYVNYYDRYEKQEFENPTIGVLLCQDKDDAMVELTLPENSNIYASKYQLYLPDKEKLQKKLMEWVKELDEGSAEKGNCK